MLLKYCQRRISMMQQQTSFDTKLLLCAKVVTHTYKHIFIFIISKFLPYTNKYFVRKPKHTIHTSVERASNKKAKA